MSLARARLLLAVLAAILATLALGAAAAQGAAPPVRLALTSQLTGAFEFAVGAVAVDNDAATPEHGDLYLVDLVKHRVEVLSPTGTFVATFGWEVNATKDAEPAATQVEKNLCTAASGDTCQAGVEGPAAGQLFEPLSVAIDPSSGEVYVTEIAPANEESGRRVQAFSAEGHWLFEIGRQVNLTKDAEPAATTAQKNLCTAIEAEKGVQCGPPKQLPQGSSEEAAFNFSNGPVLAAGGPNDLVYVGDEGRVEEFEAASGKWAGELPLASISSAQVRALAVDQQTGNIYLNSPESDLVRELNGEGSEVRSIQVKGSSGSEAFVNALAVDSAHHLAVLAQDQTARRFGSLYDDESGRRISGFALPGEHFFEAAAFDTAGDLYIASKSFEGVSEVLAYTPLAIGETLAGSSSCAAGPEQGSSATFACTLGGEVNTNGVAETEAFFQLGRTEALGDTTPAQSFPSSGPSQALVSLRPNQQYFFKLAGFDQNDKAPEEPFVSEQATLTTPTVAAHLVGSPSTISVSSGAAVLFGELNPENAHSEYFFEYAAGEHTLSACPGVRNAACPGVTVTPLSSSAVYGQIGTSAEVSSLQPASTYHYRLFAEDHSTANPSEHFKTIGPEASFTTSPQPTVHATTGPYSALTTTTAMISGTVDSEGQPATYTFELAIAGSEPQYGDVYSGTTGDATGPVAVTQHLLGLQPATTYTYRITIRNGYGEATSEPHTFTTEGFPALLTSPGALALLPTPAVAFPTDPPPGKPTVKCRRGYKLDKHGKCVKAKKKRKGHKAARRRRPRH